MPTAPQQADVPAGARFGMVVVVDMRVRAAVYEEDIWMALRAVKRLY